MAKVNNMLFKDSSGTIAKYFYFRRMGKGQFKKAPEEIVKAALLGIAASNRAALARYRRGEPIGTSRDQYERVGHLLGIHKNLRLLFPQNRDLVYRWISTRNRAFDNLSPVEVIREWGFAGLLMVRAYLDRARGQ